MGALGYRPRSLRFAPVARLVSGRYSSAVVYRKAPKLVRGFQGLCGALEPREAPPLPLGRELSG